MQSAVSLSSHSSPASTVPLTSHCAYANNQIKQERKENIKKILLLNGIWLKQWNRGAI